MSRKKSLQLLHDMLYECTRDAVEPKDEQSFEKVKKAASGITKTIRDKSLELDPVEGLAAVCLAAHIIIKALLIVGASHEDVENLKDSL